MKTATLALQNLLATRQFLYANLYQFNLINASTLYYCGGDLDISYGGNTYSAGASTGPYYDTHNNKAKYHCKIGTAVDTMSFDVMPGSSAINGQPFTQAVQQGVFDGAELLFHRAYWSSLGFQAPPLVPVGVVANIFVGRVAEVDAGRSLCSFSVNSHLELLNQNMPRNLYQSACRHTLYDAGCTLNQASFAITGTAVAGSTSSSINASLANATGYFDLGKITFTSGANNGLWRSVKHFISATSISLISPFPNAPAAGDAFTIYPGCDKQQSTCGSKFSNLVNFGGFPYIPANSTAV